LSLTIPMCCNPFCWSTPGITSWLDIPMSIAVSRMRSAPLLSWPPGQGEISRAFSQVFPLLSVSTRSGRSPIRWCPAASLVPPCPSPGTYSQ
jgi:hypothetical protein